MLSSLFVPGEYVDVMKSGICDPVETLIYELYHIARWASELLRHPYKS